MEGGRKGARETESEKENRGGGIDFTGNLWAGKAHRFGIRGAQIEVGGLSGAGNPRRAGRLNLANERAGQSPLRGGARRGFTGRGRGIDARKTRLHLDALGLGE